MVTKQKGLKLKVRNFHVVGGGCFGTQYVSWLFRAKKLGMVDFEKIFAIDKNPECQLQNENFDKDYLEILPKDWIEYFSEYLLENYKESRAQEDYWVPSPFSPPILFLGFLRTAKQIQRSLDFEPTTFREEIEIPVKIPLKQGPLAVSFARWKCPVNCIEPSNCPAIHEPRIWEMKNTLEDYFQNQSSTRSAHVLKCQHLVHGVGAIPCSMIISEFQKLVGNLKKEPLEDVVVATVSGCHGLIGRAIRSAEVNSSLLKLRGRILSPP